MIRSAFRYLLAPALMLASLAYAQGGGGLFRSYLSPTGNDANPCTLVAPCRLLPAALAVVANGGEVWMLDSANYNTASVTIAKSVTILAVPGAVGSVLAIGGPALNVNAAGAKVTLRNLVIVPSVPAAGGTYGVLVNAGAELHVERCTISNHAADGIWFIPPGRITVVDSVFRGSTSGALRFGSGTTASVTRTMISGQPGDSGSNGIWTEAGAGFASSLEVTDSVIDNSYVGVSASAGGVNARARVGLQRVRISGTDYGVSVGSSTSGQVRVVMSDSRVAGAVQGVASFVAADTKVTLRNNVLSDNGIGVNMSAGVIESAGDNTFVNNSTDVAGSIVPLVRK